MVKTNKEVAQTWAAPVGFVESTGDSTSFGSGFLCNSRNPATLLFFTAKHMVTGKNSLKVNSRAADSTGKELVLTFTVSLKHDGAQNYYIPDSAQDCVAIPIPTAKLQAVLPTGFSFYVFTTDAFVKAEDLVAGVDVVVCGYPLGLKLGTNTAMIRKGSIAGVDKQQNIVLLDISTMGGFSGGPVIIDKTTNMGREFSGSLVGLCFGYNLRQSSRQIPKGESTLTYTETLQLAQVVPADVLEKALGFVK